MMEPCCTFPYPEMRRRDFCEKGLQSLGLTTMQEQHTKLQGQTPRFTVTVKIASTVTATRKLSYYCLISDSSLMLLIKSFE